MIKNSWDKALITAGRTKSELAKEVGINKGTFSQVCSGQRILKHETFARCVEALGCKPSDIYTWTTLYGLYGMKNPESNPRKKRATRVTIREEIADTIAAMVEQGGVESVEAAVNDMCTVMCNVMMKEMRKTVV